MLKNILKVIFQPSDRGKIRIFFLFILILVLLGGLIDFGNYYNKGVDYISNKTENKIKLPYTKERKFMLGLDLQGGTHLVYQANMSEIEKSDRSSSLSGVRDVISRRVDPSGLNESVVQTNISGDDYRLIVELAGVKDANEAINKIGETPILEFKELGVENRELTDEEQNEINSFNENSKKQASEVLAKVLSGEDFATAAKEYSQDNNTKEKGGDFGWINKKNNPDLIELVKDFEIGQINDELIKASNGYEIVLLEDKKTQKNLFDENKVEKEVEASHILICHNEAEGCENDISKDEALSKIKEIEKKINPENFAELAKEYSTDSSAEKGGNLGWFEKSDMVKPFADTVFDNQKVGEISYIVETKFGYHLILKTDEKEIFDYKIRHIFIATKSKQDYVNQKEWKNTDLTGKHLEKAVIRINNTDGTPEVSLNFNPEGAKLFSDITENNIGNQVGIFLDGYIISAPTVNTKISNGEAVISGRFNIEEAKQLTKRLNAGALPVPIELISQQTVGSSLGQKSLETSLKAGLIGLALVALFMLIYYRFLGFLAVLSLCVYGILIMAIFKIFAITLTLSGIAGFILSIGMAVDANVLVFERLKEELKNNSPLDMAIDNSFLRAWPSIRDGNISTLITCFILMQFSTSIVKGFAITLGLGVIVSMFSAIIVTKTFMQIFVFDFFEKNLWILGINKINKSN